ncbi:hypothetical protein AHiyo4_11380 [Arthrobacter sp. Hiyo4]|nr:hypothetical protein AHiyo4_11380 [Arthrobacter sp. Hiyo4]
MGRLGAELGGSAVLIDGADFSALSQEDQRARIEVPLLAAIEKHGSAQLIFDSYDRAIVGPKGARLQSWLTSRLIDGAYAQDVGSIFTARCGTELTRTGAGSPLMSRVTPLDPPRLQLEDIEADEQNTIHEWFGESALLAERATNSGSFDPIAIADRFEQDLSYIDDVQKAASAAIARGYMNRESDSFAARCAAYGLLTEKGTTILHERLRPALTATSATDPKWPGDWEACIAKFSQLVAGAHEVIWSDRYMYRDIQTLRAFLKKVTERTTCNIRLLGGQAVNDRSISVAEMHLLNNLACVEARWMTDADYWILHDRHLDIGLGGWVLPQVHVIVGKQDPGSAVVAQRLHLVWTTLRYGGAR